MPQRPYYPTRTAWEAAQLCALKRGMRRGITLLCCLALGAALAHGSSHEQAGLQQTERVPSVPLPQVTSPQGMERLPADETPCIALKRLRLLGDGAQAFHWILAYAHKLPDGTRDSAVPRCLGTAGVNILMRRMQNALIAKGYVLARVLMGPQPHLSEGTLELTLFPGRIRRIAGAQTTDSWARYWNAFPMRAGDVLNLRDTEQALENLKRLPTVEAGLEFRAAQGPDALPGQTDVLVQWKQTLPFRLSVSADDSGAKDTGKYQGSVVFAYDHWWKLNDLFYVSFNNDLGGRGAGGEAYGTRGHTLHYSVPFGYWLVELTASSNRYYQSVAGANQTYLYSGTSQNGEGTLSRVLYRDASRKTMGFLRGWTRTSHNYIDDMELEVQRRRMAGWELGVSHKESRGAASLDVQFNYRRGVKTWGTLAAPEEAWGEGTARPRLLTARIQLNVPFQLAHQAWTYTSTWHGQREHTPLIPQDRFAIGGRHSVRGFDGERQLIAERGWWLRNDLAVALGHTGQLCYVGVDYGRVAGPSSARLVGSRLSGVVWGVRGAFRQLAYDAFIGKPVQKPTGLQTASVAMGFQITGSF